MRFTLMFILFLPWILSSQDFNYEFVTNGVSKEEISELTFPTDSTITLESNSFRIRVIKNYDELIVVSNMDMSNIKFNGKITYIGRDVFNRDLAYRYRNEMDKAYYFRVNPSYAYIKMTESDGTLVFEFGSKK